MKKTMKETNILKLKMRMSVITKTNVEKSNFICSSWKESLFVVL